MWFLRHLKSHRRRGPYSLQSTKWITICSSQRLTDKSFEGEEKEWQRAYMNLLTQNMSNTCERKSAWNYMLVSYYTCTNVHVNNIIMVHYNKNHWISLCAHTSDYVHLPTYIHVLIMYQVLSDKPQILFIVDTTLWTYLRRITQWRGWPCMAHLHLPYHDKFTPYDNKTDYLLHLCSSNCYDDPTSSLEECVDQLCV